MVYDAGDVIESLLRARVDLVLAGHKHVPYAWRLENLFVVTAGTVSTQRLRGHTRPCYNVIEAPTAPSTWRRYPFDGEERIIKFSTETLAFEKYTTRIEDEVKAMTDAAHVSEATMAVRSRRAQCKEARARRASRRQRRQPLAEPGSAGQARGWSEA